MGVGDAGVGDTGVGDKGVGDAGVSDAGVGDMGVGDAVVGDTGVEDCAAGCNGCVGAAGDDVRIGAAGPFVSGWRMIEYSDGMVGVDEISVDGMRIVRDDEHERGKPVESGGRSPVPHCLDFEADVPAEDSGW